jgi:hypothetical protein
MIHVATVHYQNDEWIDIQLDYLRENLSEEFKVYAFLNGIDERHKSKFFYSTTEPVQASQQEEEHAIKLNLLADIIYFSADSPDDLLIFIDGDAFPIADVATYARSKLEEYPLLAVQRLENSGDIQPHPSFCATTIGFWEDIGGDWKPGYQWENDERRVTDVGGNLLEILEQEDIGWYPMHRSNKKDLHPLWFGIYDDVVYHHGAGFRQMISRVDLGKNFHTRTIALAYRVSESISPRIPGVERIPGVRRLQDQIEKAFFSSVERLASENCELSEKVINKLRNDRDFYERFM